MKTRIAFFALTVAVFAVTGCAGTQVAVGRFGMRPGVQRFEPENAGAAESETMPFFMPDNRFGVFSAFGFNDFQQVQKPAAFELPYAFGGPLNLFSGTRLTQKPLQVVFPYNQDASLTLFRHNIFQIKLLPMTDGRF